MLPGHVQDSRKSNAFPWGLSPILSPWIFQEPKGFPKTKETVVFHESLEGGKKGQSTFCRFHCLYCCSVATEMALQAVLTDLCSQDVLAVLDSCLRGDPHLDEKCYPLLCRPTYACMFSHCPRTRVPSSGSWTCHLQSRTSPHTLKGLMEGPPPSWDLHNESPFKDIVLFADTRWGH